jgi:hypothetical protein
MYEPRVAFRVRKPSQNLQLPQPYTMLSLILIPIISLLQITLAAPVSNAAAATVGKIRGVRDPIYHLYLQANSKNGTSHTPLHITSLTQQLRSIHTRPRSRIRRRRLQHRRNHPVQENWEIPKHPNRIDELQATCLGPRGRHNCVGT